MANIEYDMDKELEHDVASMIEDATLSEFEELRELGIVVSPCMRVRMNPDGEAQPCTGEPVSVKRVGPVERLFMPKKPHFLLVVDYGAWSAVDEQRRKTILHRGLMRIVVEKTDDGIHLSTRKPDIVEFIRTVERFGAYTEQLLNLREAFRNSINRILPTVEAVEEVAEEAVNNSADNQ